jgi:agmatine deiminase
MKKTSKRRLPAEWEPQSAVQFTFPHEDTDWGPILDEVIPCFVACVEAVSRFQQVIVVCGRAEEVRSLFDESIQKNLILVECPSNDTWARDHGAITILEDGRPVLLDFVFNGWGLKFPANLDNGITRCMHRQGVFGATPIRHGGLVLEGGGIESDGQGTLLTTAECLLSPNRNPHLSKKELEQYLKNTFGLDRILWLHHGYLAGDDTDSHIDTLARFCDPSTIAYVQCLDPADEHFEALKFMEEELRSFRTVSGQPYRLVPLPLPDPILDPDDGRRLPATYANFLIVNGAVLAPVYGVAQDEEALQQLKVSFPSHEIVPIDCRPLIRQHGSLHCISMQYPAVVTVGGLRL